MKNCETRVNDILLGCGPSRHAFGNLTTMLAFRPGDMGDSTVAAVADNAAPSHEDLHHVVTVHDTQNSIGRAVSPKLVPPIHGEGFRAVCVLLRDKLQAAIALLDHDIRPVGRREAPDDFRLGALVSPLEVPVGPVAHSPHCKNTEEHRAQPNTGSCTGSTSTCARTGSTSTGSARTGSARTSARTTGSGSASACSRRTTSGRTGRSGDQAQLRAPARA